MSRSFHQIHSGFTFKAMRCFTILSAWLMTVSLLNPPERPNAVTVRPNIIFIMADDMGYSDLGCYGGEVNTPNLDQLAANGIKLKKFYNNSRCCPTRASLLTGQYPHTVGMGGMVGLAKAPIEKGSYQGFLNDSFPTIAEELKNSISVIS
jgi:arylsulfatase